MVFGRGLNIRYHIRRLKWFFHRGWYGWAPNDCWSLDFCLARIISEGTEHIRKYNIGYPTMIVIEEGISSDVREMTKEEHNRAEKRWDEILQKISHGFRIYLEAEECEQCGYSINMEEINDKYKCDMHKLSDYEEGWDLFRKYFGGLWY